MKRTFQKQIDENISTHLSLINLSNTLEKVITLLSKKIKNGGKILLCGNGGSAADAQHLAAEFLVRLRPEINRSPIPAISLAQDTSTITACGNDFSFEDVFLRSLQALGNKKDVLVCISTSGNSKKYTEGIKRSKKKKKI